MARQVASNIARYVNFYGISKAKLARLSCLAESTLTQLAEGEDFTPRLRQSARAMIVLGVSPEDVLGDAEVNRLLDALESN